MSHFGVLHWQQWQPPTSAPGSNYDWSASITAILFLLLTIVPLVNQGFVFSFNAVLVNFCVGAYMSRSILNIKKNLLDLVINVFFIKLEDIVPVLLNLFKKCLLIKMMYITLMYVFVVIPFKLIKLQK